MNNELRQMHRRAAVVAAAGMILGALLQASLIGAQSRPSSQTFARPAVSDHSQTSVAAAQCRQQPAPSATQTHHPGALEVADRALAAGSN